MTPLIVGSILLVGLLVGLYVGYKMGIKQYQEALAATVVIAYGDITDEALTFDELVKKITAVGGDSKEQVWQLVREARKQQ